MALKTDLKAYWKLEEASGTRVDAHGDNDLAETGTVLSAAGKVGDAAAFDGTAGEYLSLADDADLSPGTDTALAMCGWVLFTAVGGTQVLWGKGSTNTGATVEYQLVSEGASAMKFYTGNGSTFASVTSSVTFSDSTWYFVACWHDPAADEIYISVNAGSADSAAWTGGTWNGSGDFRIGRDPSYASEANARIDEVAVRIGSFWSGAELTEIYNSGSGLGYDSWDAPAGASQLVGGVLVDNGLARGRLVA